jgi:hypothetical protein
MSIAPVEQRDNPTKDQLPPPLGVRQIKDCCQFQHPSRDGPWCQHKHRRNESNFHRPAATAATATLTRPSRRRNPRRSSWFARTAPDPPLPAVGGPSGKLLDRSAELPRGPRCRPAPEGRAMGPYGLDLRSHSRPRAAADGRRAGRSPGPRTTVRAQATLLPPVIRRPRSQQPEKRSP